MNVNASPENMERMMKLSKGSRNVPVIVEGGMVVVGYGGT
ncbi:MAG TPA: hypothetical protein DCR11_04630 [Deltaproteobacteria bacterium]|nr:hypothetical protein [Deltaproteobacteria bacterium]